MPRPRKGVGPALVYLIVGLPGAGKTTYAKELEASAPALRLTPDEWQIMKQHARLGAEAIDRAVADTHQPVPFLSYARQIALHHHERWDGTGYPRGLRGEGIPIVGRIVAVADVFDALTHDRPYKAAWSVEQALAEIEQQAGAQFDPQVVEAFLETLRRMGFLGSASALEVPVAG